MKIINDPKLFNLLEINLAMSGFDPLNISCEVQDRIKFAEEQSRNQEQPDIIKELKEFTLK